MRYRAAIISLAQPGEDDGFFARNVGRPLAREVRDAAAQDTWNTLTE